MFAIIVAYLWYNIIFNHISSQSMLHRLLCIVPLICCIMLKYTLGIYLIELFLMSRILITVTCVMSSRIGFKMTTLHAITMFLFDVLIWFIFLGKLIACAPRGSYYVLGLHDSSFLAIPRYNCAYIMMFAAYLIYGGINLFRYLRLIR